MGNQVWQNVESMAFRCEPLYLKRPGVSLCILVSESSEKSELTHHEPRWGNYRGIIAGLAWEAHERLLTSGKERISNPIGDDTRLACCVQWTLT